MAHNLHFHADRNQYSFFSVREKAWHGLGIVIDDYPDSASALRFAGLDYEVVKRPNLHRLEDGTEIVSGDSFFTYRTDTGDVLGSRLGKDYEVVQNTDAFAFFDAIVGGDGIQFETAGALGRGERIFITAKLPGYIRVQGEDLVEKYLFLTTSHDGSGAITAAFTPVRIVCNNTLSLALGDCTHRLTIRHTRDARLRLENAHRVMGIANRLSDELDGIFNRWARVRISDADVRSLIRQALAPARETLAGQDPATAAELSTYLQRICDTAYAYTLSAPSQQLESTRGTLFGAYNGITGYFQNVRDYRGAEDKMNSILYGGLAEQRARDAFRICRSFAETGSLS